MGRPLPKKTVDEVLRLHRAGLTHRQIGVRLNLSPATAYTVLYRRGIRIPLDGGACVVRDPRGKYSVGAEFSIKDVFAGMAIRDKGGNGAWHNGMQFAVTPRPGKGDPYVATVIGRVMIRHDTGEQLVPRTCGGGSWVPQ